VNAAAREIGNVRSQAEPEPHQMTRGNFSTFNNATNGVDQNHRDECNESIGEKKLGPFAFGGVK
jgi:hypothetical protein